MENTNIIKQDGKSTSAKNVNEKSKLVRFLEQNWITILAMVYVLSPVDLIPEAFIPVVGIADDAVVVLLELIRKWRMFSKSKDNSKDNSEGNSD